MSQTIAVTEASAKREELIDNGFCVFESILDPDMVKRVTDASDRLLD